VGPPPPRPTADNVSGLVKELMNRGMEFRSQPVVLIKYKGEVLNKSYQPDFICFDEVLVKIKALSNLSGTEQSQIINYLKATGLETGLLINFGATTLEYRRFVYTK
jgi:GxxExxY protein